MTVFASLSAFARALFALWALLLCLINLGNAALATVKKRYVYTAFAAVLFAPVYFMWQVIFDFSLFEKIGEIKEITEKLCNLGVGLWFGALAVLTAFSLLLFIFNIRYDKTYITPGTIKLYLDKMPCGICCWRENGRVLFSNICMNDLCSSITHNQLLNGNHFREAIKDEIIQVDEKIWRFVCREINLDGERLWEMIASDITNEYAKTRALEKDKAELSRLNNELREYYLSIDESVRHQEILQAKMNIHDEMNRLMLSTVSADGENTQALDEIFKLWEQNALLLRPDSDIKTKAQPSEALNSLADALGINLIFEDNMPAMSEEQKELFYFTAQEAVINAVKHAGAKNMEISFEKTDESLTCFFKNDGALPNENIEFEGGLANLEMLCKRQGAEISAVVGDCFTLILKINKNHTIG